MRFHWRDTPIGGHAAWRDRISKKDDQPGRSAPTIAAAWSGPAELFAAVDGIDALDDLVVETVGAEVQTSFDHYPGGKRNHDLVVEGTARGGRVVVCVEAKAGETFGEKVGEVIASAENRRSEGKNTNAPARVRDLLEQWLPDLDPSSDEVKQLRYQLLTALAGTEAEGTRRNADHAVLFVHEFQTDERSADENADDLRKLMAAGFREVTLPSDQDLPWCVELRAGSDEHPTLYLAKAVTDLRPANAREGIA